MSSMRTVGMLVVAGAMLPFCGCASIISGRQATVAIDSFPSNAHVTIKDKEGREVAQVTTPATVTLKRNGKYFMPAQYTATIEAPGYAKTEVPIRSTLNPWIAGNILAGGVIGLAIDDATGAAWKPKQDRIMAPLAPLGPNGHAQQIAAAPATPPPAASADAAKGVPLFGNQASPPSARPVQYTAENSAATSRPQPSGVY